MAERSLDCTIEEMCHQACVSTDDCNAALKVSQKCVCVILKRSVKDRFINNYNPRWLKAWRGNLDLQFCPDQFAVMTYITDYYSKDESGTVDVLSKAWKSSKNLLLRNRLTNFKNTLLTHRQMGASEAYYRIIPSLKVKNSSIGTVFATSGFPHNRSKFYKQLAEDTQANPLKDTVTIDGRSGKFQESESVHDHYSRRPPGLEEMCLAEFVISYIRGKAHSKVEMHDRVSIKTGLLLSLFNGEPLPKAIVCLYESKEVYMTLRTHRIVLRINKYRDTSSREEHAYSEMLLYTPWRSESNDLFCDDPEKCMQIFATPDVMAVVNSNKVAVFPYHSKITDLQEYLASNPDIHAQHTYDLLNIEGEQQNADDDAEGVHIDIDHAYCDPTGLDPDEDQLRVSKSRNQDQRSSIYVQPLLELNEISENIRLHSKDQHLAFSIVLNYVHGIVRNAKMLVPTPPLLFIHGGAGTGKSLLINNMANIVEHLLRQHDPGSPMRPYALKTAPTGMAASNIGGKVQTCMTDIIKCVAVTMYFLGHTLHTALSLPFKNAYEALSDEKQDRLRDLLADLKLLIIDEISMVRPDQLYQIHQRLIEIKSCKDTFGGVAVVVVGDLMQLRPVFSDFVFGLPNDQKHSSYHVTDALFPKFEVIELNTNHRQGEYTEFGNMMERLRFGESSEQDFATFEERIIGPQNTLPDNSLQIFGTNAAVEKANMIRLQALGTPEVCVKAILSPPPGLPNYSVKIGKDGTVDNTPYMNVLHLKKGARVMITHNIRLVESKRYGNIVL